MRLVGCSILFLLIPCLEAAPETKDCENGLVRTKVAGDPFFKNPVALSVDVDGSLYVTESERRKVGDLDIREATWWIPNDLSHSSIEEKQAFFRKEVTTDRFKDHRSVEDFNQDGQIDWKDLTMTSEKIHRLTDSDGDGVMDTHTLFAEGFNTEVTGIAAGVLAQRGDVYATIAPDVWKLRDTSGDGVADQRESLAHGFGLHINYAGHDMHGLTFGPDGRLYWTIGDKGTNVVSKEGTRWFFPDEGALLRCYPDGSGFEVYARGLRNVQEIAFDDFGNVFGVDNDSDQKGEKERFVFIAPGSDTGWRVFYQYRKSDYNPWMLENISAPSGDFRPATWLRPICEYLDGPAGFSRDPGTALDERHRGAFFLSQFPAGKINAFKTEPDGAGFKMVDEHLVAEGDAFVGSNFGPDGALYVVDWQGGYPLNAKGAVWKIDDPKSANSPIRQEVASFLREGPGEIESSALVSRLGHPDQRVRLDAQWELAKRREWALLKQAASSPAAEPIAIAHALWGLAQGQQFDSELFAALSKSRESEVRAQAAKWAGDTNAEGADLAPLLADPSARVRFLCALAVSQLRIEVLTPAVITLLAENNDTDAWLRHAGITALAALAKPDELAALTANPSPAVRRAAVIAARQAIEAIHCIRPNDAEPSTEAAAPYAEALADFLGDSDPSIVSEAAIAIHSSRLAAPALPALAGLLKKNPDAPEPAIRRAISAARQLANPSDLLHLANYAARSSSPVILRRNALHTLASAAKPLQLDSVDGHWCDLPAATLEKETRRSLGVALASINHNKLKQSAGEALDAVGERLDAKQLAARARDSKLDPALRVLALTSLKGLDKNTWKATAIEMIRDAQASLRIAVAKQLTKDEPAAVVSYVKNIGLPSEELTERQAAVALLPDLDAPEAREILKRLLADDKAEPALLLDILEAAKSAKLDTASRESSIGTRHLLSGGDAEAGRQTFEANLSANCTACHRIGEEGSNVGPALTEIGHMGREHILESLIDPQAKIAEGFPTPSSMPPMGLILPPREIRDLVEFLSTVK
ncbi:c-type cytochrome [Haloferula chungangensis]|uniref:C-type cytochrome n=1 Tax=Haloferula chungangensis TaxID=1048331 RepID=A0ABW2LCJ5_9BACT